MNVALRPIFSCTTSSLLGTPHGKWFNNRASTCLVGTPCFQTATRGWILPVCTGSVGLTTGQSRGSHQVPKLWGVRVCAGNPVESPPSIHCKFFSPPAAREMEAKALSLQILLPLPATVFKNGNARTKLQETQSLPRGWPISGLLHLRKVQVATCLVSLKSTQLPYNYCCSPLW